jgi:hypothetical protein
MTYIIAFASLCSSEIREARKIVSKRKEAI